MQCSASVIKDNEVSFVWTRNGKNIAFWNNKFGNLRYRHEVEVDSTSGTTYSKLRFLEKPTAGNYSCQSRIHNETSGHLRIYEKNVSLDIDRAPKSSFIQLLPGNSRNQRGFMQFDRLELVCKDNSLETRPKPSISWYKNNQLIKDENKNILVIPVLDVRDSGAYECKFENYVGSGSRMYVLVVEHAPAKADLIRMDAKHTSKLICSGDGVPRPTKFEWDIRTEGCMK